MSQVTYEEDGTTHTLDCKCDFCEAFNAPEQVEWETDPRTVMGLLAGMVVRGHMMPDEFELLGEFCCIRCGAELHPLGEKQCPCAWCPTCKAMTEVLASGSSFGFCAGSVYWWVLACGHGGMDDQSYLEA